MEILLFSTRLSLTIPIGHFCSHGLAQPMTKLNKISLLLLKMQSHLRNFHLLTILLLQVTRAFQISMNKEMNSSMGILLGLSAIFMVIVLLIVFRHVRWCLLPLPVVLLGIVYTFGAMGYVGIPMSMVSMSAFPIS